VCKSADDAGVFHVLPAYHNHDLSLRTVNGAMFNLSMGIENILDCKYLREYGFPAAGRDFFFSMGLDL
jgi:outer membrane cobalamin receptor